MSQDSMNNCSGKLSLNQYIMLIFIYLQSQYSLGSEWVKTLWLIAEENSLWLKTLCWFSSNFSPNILWRSEWVKTPWIIAEENSLWFFKKNLLIFIYLQSQYSLGKWMSQNSMNNCSGKLSLIQYIMLIFIYIQSQYSLGSEWVKTPWIIAVENSLWLNTFCWFSSTFSPNILRGSEWVKSPWIIAVENSLWLNTICWFSSTFSPNILWGSEWLKTLWIIAEENSL